VGAASRGGRLICGSFSNRPADALLNNTMLPYMNYSTSYLLQENRKAGNSAVAELKTPW
jgi:hypothetical protein